jgi:hypothetical protein
MGKKIILCVMASFAFSSLAFAGPAKESKAPALDPCQQIEKACLDAGFVLGKSEKGYGLYNHCINPIMQGKTKAKVPGALKALPKVDAAVAAACKVNDPDFGEGDIGSQ